VRKPRRTPERIGRLLITEQQNAKEINFGCAAANAAVELRIKYDYDARFNANDRSVHARRSDSKV
jgi:hypothetical protein